MALPTVQQQNGVELQFLTNHVGHFVLVNGLVDQLADNGRVVILSSGAHHMAKRGLELDNLAGTDDYDPWRMYGRSKLANIHFTRELAKRLDKEQITVNCLHPGAVATSLGSQNEGLIAKLLPLLLKPFFRSPDRGAEKLERGRRNWREVTENY